MIHGVVDMLSVYYKMSKESSYTNSGSSLLRRSGPGEAVQSTNRRLAACSTNIVRLTLVIIREVEILLDQVFKDLGYQSVMRISAHTVAMIWSMAYSMIGIAGSTTVAPDVITLPLLKAFRRKDF
jgi:hypothetical protein